MRIEKVLLCLKHNSTLAHHRYLLTYPDGSREHIDRETRDNLLLSLKAKQTGPQKYRFIGETRTFHSFSELGALYLEANTQPLRRFLAGRFVFALKGNRHRELMETPEGMAFRMARASNYVQAEA